MQNKFKNYLQLTTYCLLLTLVSGGCSKDFDDSAIWSELNKQADRLTKLEVWQIQVNNNITSLQGLVNALQNTDAITGTSPFILPEPGGFDVTFKSGNTIRIYNGAKGNKGEKGDKGDTGEKGIKGDNGDPGYTPIISVAEYPTGSGVYYWTLNGNWLFDNSSNMISVTGPKGEQGSTGTPGVPGQNGVIPQVRINYATNYWEISTDNGVTWLSTGVNAAGPNDGPQGPAGEQGQQGEKGQKGDAVFAKDGVNFSHPDYVVFTLSNNTIITLPKYKTIGIVFNQPASFFPGEMKEIYYYYSGEAPAVIRALEVPDGWSVIVDRNNMRLVVTAPTSGSPEAIAGVYEAIILISDGIERMAAQTLRLEL